MIRTGIIGFSEGNGHPFSFSAIVNGYDDQAFAAAGWPVIHNYLKAQGPERFGIAGVRITSAWTQDAGLTQTLCAACKIETACATPEEMIGQVDAVIVARDDWETHARFADALPRGGPLRVRRQAALAGRWGAGAVRAVFCEAAS